MSSPKLAGAPVADPEQLRQALGLFRQPSSSARILGPDTPEAQQFAVANKAIRDSMRGRVFSALEE